MKKIFLNQRIEYHGNPINPEELPTDPFILFTGWLEEALQQPDCIPLAMVLSTVGPDHEADSRVVLLRDYNRRGFIFYSSYQSNKGKQLESNPRGALLFFWPASARQVRIKGIIEKLDNKTSDSYFAGRDRGNKIAAWASRQSEEIYSREALLENYKHYEQKFANNDIPRPDYWGGYILIADSFEFWQGLENRLHDRFLYKKEKNIWKIVRLQP